MAEHDGDDLHDWETFNQQIEKLLLSMQKSDRAMLISPGPAFGREFSLSRPVGREQRPMFASILEHADVRQNLSQSAFEQAAETGPQAHSEALAHDLPPSDSAAALQLLVDPTTSSPEVQPSDEELLHSTPVGMRKSAETQMHVSFTGHAAEHLAATRVQSAKTPEEQDMQGLGGAEQPSSGTSADGPAGLQEEMLLDDNPYGVLLQQIDLHIATCQASLASIYPVKLGHDSAEPSTPAQADSMQFTSSSPMQRSIYRNALYEGLPDSLDSPCGISVADSKQKSLAGAPQPSAEEVPESTAAEALHIQLATPFGSPAGAAEHPGPANVPEATPPSAQMPEVIQEQSAQRQPPAADWSALGHAADCAVKPKSCPAGQQAALAEHYMPGGGAFELDARQSSDQALPEVLLPSEGASAGQPAQAPGGAAPLEAASTVTGQGEPLLPACSAEQGANTAGLESAEPSGRAELALQAAASADGSVLETLDEAEEEQPLLIAAWWPPGVSQPEQALSLPGPGSREPRHRPLDTASAGPPQQSVSVAFRDAERHAVSSRNSGTRAACEMEQDTERVPSRILRLSLSPPCSGLRGIHAGEAAGESSNQSFSAEVVDGPHKETASPEMPGCVQAQDLAASERGAMHDRDAQGICEAIASPKADVPAQDLQEWQQYTTAKLLEVYEDLALQEDGALEPVEAQLTAKGLDTADERAHQAEVARRCLEARLGAHAVELAERDTQVAYLSSAVGLAEDLLTAKQRKVEELSGESLGLQDVLSEAGAEAVSKAVRLTELETEMMQQQKQLAQAHQQLAEREQQLAQCRADLADAHRQLAVAQAASPTTFALTPSLPSRSSHAHETDKLRDAYKLQPLFTSTLLPGTIHRPMLFTPPGAQEEAGSPMSAVSVSALHGAVPGSGGRAQRSAWEALTPPLSHGKRTTEALTVVLRRIRSREEAA